MKKILLSFICAIGISVTAFGQVATPSLNPSLTSEMPAAASWRYSSTISAEANRGSGKIENGTGDKLFDIDTSGYSAQLALQIDALTIEYQNTPNAELETEASDGTKIKTKVKGDILNLAFRFGDNVSIGLARKTQKTSLDPEDKTMEYEYEHLGGGFSLRIADILFLGYGAEQVKQSLEDKDDNKYTDQFLGAGILAGDPGKGQIRIEYSMQISPESKQNDGNNHKGFNDSKYTVDLKLGDFLLSYQNGKKVTENIDTDDKTTEKVVGYGLGYSPEKGFLVTLSRYDRKEDYDENDNESKRSSYSVALGYNF